MSDRSPVALGVLLSGSGRTLQNLLDRIATGALRARVRCAIADRAEAFGLERARRAGLPAYVEREPLAIFARLRAHGVELVCLAGYLRLLPIPPDYAGAVLNIHPALLPKFGGRGMYGARVHRAVLAAGERTSGCTVHLCDDQYDHGPILVQREVPVLAADTPEALAARVFAAECEAYPEAIRRWAEARHARVGSRP